MRGSVTSKQSGYHGQGSQENSGSIVLFKNNFRITKDSGDSAQESMNSSNQGSGFGVNLGERFELHTGSGPTSIVLSFSDAQRTRQLEKYFGTGPSAAANNKQNAGQYSQSKLQLVFNSKNSRDLFLMSVRCFEAQITLEDGVVFEQVKRKLNEDLSENKEDCINLLTSNQQLLRELTFLYENNTHLSKENE